MRARVRALFGISAVQAGATVARQPRDTQSYSPSLGATRPIYRWPRGHAVSSALGVVATRHGGDTVICFALDGNIIFLAALGRSQSRQQPWSSRMVATTRIRGVAKPWLRVWLTAANASTLLRKVGWRISYCFLCFPPLTPRAAVAVELVVLSPESLDALAFLWRPPVAVVFVPLSLLLVVVVALWRPELAVMFVLLPRWSPPAVAGMVVVLLSLAAGGTVVVVLLSLAAETVVVVVLLPRTAAEAALLLPASAAVEKSPLMFMPGPFWVSVAAVWKSDATSDNGPVLAVRVLRAPSMFHARLNGAGKLPVRRTVLPVPRKLPPELKSPWTRMLFVPHMFTAEPK
jgi:hypothetical protein